jgi:ribosome recycling factor
MRMEFVDVIDQINHQYDREMVDKIDFFGAHGVNVRDVKQIGTERYIRFLDANKRPMTDQRVRVSREEAQKIHDRYQTEIDRIMGKRKLHGGRSTPIRGKA